MTKNNSGQALLEWCIWGSGLALLWSVSWNLGVFLLHKSIADSLSMISARQTLSRQKTDVPLRPSMIVIQKKIGIESAQAIAQSEESRTTSRIQIPKTPQEARSWWDLWFSGFPYFSSLQ